MSPKDPPSLSITSIPHSAFIMWIPGLELKSSNIVLAAITAAPQVLRQASCCISHNDLQCHILPQPPKCLRYMCAPSYSTTNTNLKSVAAGLCHATSFMYLSSQAGPETLGLPVHLKIIYFFLLFFKTGSLLVAPGVLELILYNRLALSSENLLPMFPKYWG